MSDLRVVVLVSPDCSATYFANILLQELNVVGVFVERQHRSPSFSEKVQKAFSLLLNPKELTNKVYDNFVFNYYEKTISGPIYELGYGENGSRLYEKESCQFIYTEGARQINNERYIRIMQQLRPDVIAICGTSIVKESILKLPRHGVLNLHSGLPQKYRGMSTVQWAIYNKEPEYIGVTVHFCNAGADTGRIIYQGRPGITPEDNPSSLHVKVVKLGTEMMIRAIKDIEAGTVVSYHQETVGDLYLERMFTAKVLKETWRKSGQGVLNDYLQNKSSRDEKVNEMIVGDYKGIS